ncbi:MAG: hypothetical protein ACREQ5_10805 [Candidatus Dormibacteria bacterium]
MPPHDLRLDATELGELRRGKYLSGANAAMVELGGRPYGVLFGEDT